MGTPAVQASGARPQTATEPCHFLPEQSTLLPPRAIRPAAKTKRRIRSDGPRNGRHRGDRIAGGNRPTGHKTSTLHQKPPPHAWSCPPLIFAQEPPVSLPTISFLDTPEAASNMRALFLLLLAVLVVPIANPTPALSPVLHLMRRRFASPVCRTVMVIAVSEMFVQITAAGAGGPADDQSFTAARQASD